jgi:hypothetical protein
MAANEEPSRSKSWMSLATPGRLKLAALIAILFLILHILAGSLLRPSSSNAAPDSGETTSSSSYD